MRADMMAVLRNYPKAYARRVTREWLIYCPLPHRLAIIGRGFNRAEAWKDAINFGPDTSKGAR